MSLPGSAGLPEQGVVGDGAAAQHVGWETAEPLALGEMATGHTGVFGSSMVALAAKARPVGVLLLNMGSMHLNFSVCPRSCPRD